MQPTAQKFSVCLYGTRDVGFTFLVSADGVPGIYPTSGKGSDCGSSMIVRRGERNPAATMAEVVRLALAQIPFGAPVNIHLPGTGRLRKPPAGEPFYTGKKPE